MRNEIKKFPKFFASLLLRVVIAILVGALLLTLVYMIPADAMAENVEESAQLLYEEGVYPWLYPWCTSMLDNFTDTFMLMHAAYKNDQPAIMQAMNIYRPYFGTKDMPYQDMVDHYIEGKSYTGEITYERYWHGYLLYLKPMLTVMNYGSIRKVNGIVQTALLLAVIFLLVKRGKKRYIPAYLIAVGLLMPVTLVLSLQFSSCYYAMTLGCLALLLCGDKLEKREHLIFLYIGIFVAFFDFLTYPIATIGVPAAMYFVLREGGSVKEDLGKLVKLCFCWGVGYAGMWGGKWILGSILTGNNQLTGAMGKIQERTTSGNVEIYGETVENPMWKAYTENRDYFWNTPATKLMYLLLAVLLVLFVIALLRRKTNLRVLTRAVPFVIIACMPVVWYMLTANHSIMHAWFTNKALVVLAFAVMCLMTRLLDRPAECHLSA